MAVFCKLALILSFLYCILASSELDMLLNFKATIEDPGNSLSSWSSISPSHYCNWTGITCRNLTVISLDLRGLNLSGEISSALCDLPSLSLLNLAENSFDQPIPLHFSHCRSLESLNLSSNLIWGTIPDQISQIPSLKLLDFSRNHIEGSIPETISYLKNLEVLNLGSNLLSGILPSLLNLTELLSLDLSENPLLVGEIPPEMGNLEKLEQVLLRRCGFKGSIPDSFVGLQHLAVLDLSQNNLTGEVPQTMGSAMKNLVFFDVSQNRISGSFPDSICLGKSLINLILHGNFLNGTIESIGKCLNLERFEVQNNRFSGNLPEELWSLPKIKVIRAENNRFSGEIPESISLSTQLEQLQIDNNSFSGNLPHGFGSIMTLYRFSASINGFYGNLPLTICDSPVMSIINLSHNSISGNIPEFTKCRKLVSLSLSNNGFVGEIPSSLAELPVLTYLDLSENNLTGPIPEKLENLKLALFNVSFNHLSGRVPLSLISGLPASFLQGNPQLCGPGLPNSCSDDTLIPHSTFLGLSKLASVVISVLFSVFILIVGISFLALRRSYNSKSQGLVFFYPLRITEEDIAAGMNEKNAVGSEGLFGRVHILSLPSGELVAVKRLVNFNHRSSKNLRNEMKTLAKISHRNIIRILGFCHSDDSILIIYEFMKTGTLRDLMESDFDLHWHMRLKIAISIAEGLAYLHNDCIPHLIHRNIKSNNILLDADLVPKLTDFSLNKIIGETAFRSAITLESASSCYVAPENGYSKNPTPQMDVYSFGVVLLELVTGRRAEKAESEGRLDVVKWVRRKINIENGAIQVIDRKISSSLQDDTILVLNIALRCTSILPEKRPLMLEIVRELRSVSCRHERNDSITI